MRESGRWMVLLDDRILEALNEEDFMTPSELAELEAIYYSAQHVGDRCRELKRHGLAENVGNGVYIITERGEEYLKGDFNTAEGLSDDSPETDQDTLEEGSSV